MTQSKPPELKALAGTGRPDREQNSIASLLPRLDVVPSPPEWLTDPIAVREWAELAPMLVSCRVLRASMCSTLGHLCQLHSALIHGYRSGEPPRAALVAAYTRLAGLFGLTAVDSRRLPTPEKTRDEGKFSRVRVSAERAAELSRMAESLRNKRGNHGR